MEQPGHLLASRLHTEKAISNGGGNDPAVQGGLAQTEAVLAVASATGPLAAKFSHPGAPVPPTTQAPGYQVAGIRSQYPNACTPVERSGCSTVSSAMIARQEGGR